MPATSAANWLRAKPAADRLGVTVYTLHNLALAGRIRSKVDVGELPRFHAGDIDRLRLKSELATAS